MTTAVDPRGRWSRLHCVRPGRGLIDPCPFWDDDGQAYLIRAQAGSRSGGENSVLTLHRMAPDVSRLLDDGRVIIDGHHHHPIIEGPKLYKRNGWYYIFAPAGGVKGGWQAVFRSRSIDGPYEDRIALFQGNTNINGPHQGGFVGTTHGEHWFIHFQDRGAQGRVVHLQPMRWGRTTGRSSGWKPRRAPCSSRSCATPCRARIIPHRRGARPTATTSNPQASGFNGNGTPILSLSGMRSSMASCGSRPGYAFRTVSLVGSREPAAAEATGHGFPRHDEATHEAPGGRRQRRADPRERPQRGAGARHGLLRECV